MKICAIGEAMLELSSQKAGGAGALLGDGWRLGFGGDTLNTALHLARYGYDVSYLTALGTDSFSDELCLQWRAQGLGTDIVLRDPQKPTGLYAITTDEKGERSFTYWRSDSAARRLFQVEGASRAMDKAAEADVLIFSLISLAILPPEGREGLLALAARVRKKGGKVVFDGNYRPRLWSGPQEAVSWRNRALQVCDLGLPTMEDEIALGGPPTAPALAAEWRRRGAGAVVVKLGAEGAYGPDDQTRPPPSKLSPVDTTGAGDAFNAGFLSVWLKGGTASEAIDRAARLAAWVILRKGAVPPEDDGYFYQV